MSNLAACVICNWLGEGMWSRGLALLVVVRIGLE
jgi:hypothetical protein